MEGLRSRILGRHAIGEPEIAEMYALYGRYYGGTDEAQFRADLAGKDHVIELRQGDTLAGFSTVAVFEFRPQREAREITVMFSGDTIIDHRFWGTQALPAAFARFAGTVQNLGGKPLFWLLISKGHRTYRYLPLFVREYWPRHDRETPSATQALIDAIASSRFGEHYDAASGLLRFPSSRGHLKAPWTDVSACALAKPAVRFFLERNPRYGEGEELVCLAEFRADNLRGIVQRSFLEAAQCATCAA